MEGVADRGRLDFADDCADEDPPADADSDADEGRGCGGLVRAAPPPGAVPGRGRTRPARPALPARPACPARLPLLFVLPPVPPPSLPSPPSPPSFSAAAAAPLPPPAPRRAGLQDWNVGSLRPPDALPTLSALLSEPEPSALLSALLFAPLGARTSRRVRRPTGVDEPGRRRGGTPAGLAELLAAAAAEEEGLPAAAREEALADHGREDAGRREPLVRRSSMS